MKRGFLLSISLIIFIIIGITSIVRGEETNNLIKEIKITGHRIIEESTIKAKIESKAGELLSSETIRRDIEAIYKLGCFDDVQVDVEDLEDGLKLTFIISEKAKIRKVEITGNEKIETDDIKKEIDLTPSSFLDMTMVIENREKIRKLYHEKGYYLVKIKPTIKKSGNKATVEYEIREGKKIKILEITFEGNKVFSGKKLKKQMQTNEKGFFSWLTSSGILKDDVFDEDMQRVVYFYHCNGYIDVDIQKPLVKYEEEKEGIFITIQINEGTQYRVGKLKVEGDTILTPEEILKDLKTKSGEIFNREYFSRDIFTITDVYTDIGYAFCKVSPLTRVNKQLKTIDIIFNINKGEKVYINRIEITGNITTRDKVIRRELTIKEGDLYNSKQVKRSKQKVTNLGFFENVYFKTEHVSSNTINLHIEVEEQLTGALSLGIGYSSVDKLVGMATISKSNLFGRGQTLELSAEFGDSKQYFELSLTEPYIFDTSVSAGFSIYNTFKEYDNYDRRKKGSSVTLGRSIAEYIKGYLTYKWEEVDISNIAEDASSWVQEQEGVSVTSSLKLTLLRDARDNYFNPTTGNRTKVSAEYAGGFLGGDNYFTRYIGETGWYFPLFWETVLGLRGTIGYAEAFGGKDLPIYERFYVGGMTTVRGFESRSIGPKDENGDPIGGDKELIFTAEVIVPIVSEQNLKGVFFLDAGNAFDDDEDYDLESLRTGAGAGIRWYTPIGPLRLEWGYNLDPEPGEKQGIWEFSIGTFF